MEQLLEYITVVLSNDSVESIDEIDPQVFEEMRSKMNNLSEEDLKGLMKLFDVYETYYRGLAYNAYNLIDKMKEFDNKIDMSNIFSSEISRISEHVKQEGKRLNLFGKVGDMAEDRLFDLKRQLRKK